MGVWQFIVDLPYEFVSASSLWRSAYSLLRTENENPAAEVLNVPIEIVMERIQGRFHQISSRVK